MYIYMYTCIYIYIERERERKRERESELKRENNCRIIERGRSLQLDVNHTFGFQKSLLFCGGGLYLGCNASFRQKG